MKRYFLLLIIIVSLFYLSQNTTADYCAQECAFKTSDSTCYATDDSGYIGTSSRTWTCSINEKTVSGVAYIGYTLGNDCSDSSTICKQNTCPTVSYPSSPIVDGDTCTVRVPCGTYPSNCYTKYITGTWDASDNKCIVCTPSTAAKKNSELFIVGQGSNPYVYVYSTSYTLQNPGDSCLSGTTTAWQSGDAKFESACSAEAACDEKVEGDSCGTGKICDVNGNCQSPPVSACTDGTLEGACCNEPGKKCKKDAGDNLVCQLDTTCPNCVDTDPADNPKVKGVCYDTVNAVCGFTSGGCTDTCASNGAVTEYYCAGSYASKSCMPTTKSCSSGDACYYGACGDAPPYGGSGCSWWSSYFSKCSSGCPTSYPNQQYTCCASVGSGCKSDTSQCVSYDPTKGETPCCLAGGYYTCDKNEICTDDGCENICTGADKTSDLYCSKCDSCQDGVQNCGEPSVDECSPEPCTITTTNEYTKSSGYTYCRDSCAGDGATCVAVWSSTSKAWYPEGCNPDDNPHGYPTSGLCKCSKTETKFNPKTCSDGFQNCDESCKDGGDKGNIIGSCITGKETDNSYLVTFEYTEPSGLSGTKFYSDAASWNCADGIDNDKDCKVDCEDTDCIGKSIACPPNPTAVVSINPVPPCTADPKINWIDCAASASIRCQDKSGSGCNANSYGYVLYGANPGICQDSKSSYSLGGSVLVTEHKWLCAYVEDNAGNSGVSTPVEVKINRAFTIVIDARAYGEIDVPPGTEVKAYLCESSQYYCNQDSQYLAAASGIVGADKRFRITVAKGLVRGTKYKVGVAMEKGYAESEFIA